MTRPRTTASEPMRVLRAIRRAVSEGRSPLIGTLVTDTGLSRELVERSIERLVDMGRLRSIDDGHAVELVTEGVIIPRAFHLPTESSGEAVGGHGGRGDPGTGPTEPGETPAPASPDDQEGT